MIEKIENAIRELFFLLQTARLYGSEHQITRKAAEKSYPGILSGVGDKDELIIGIVGDELVFEKEIFFDLSKQLKLMIRFLKSRGIHRICFNRAFTIDDLNKFVDFLMRSTEQIKDEVGERLLLEGVKNITLGKLKVSSEQVEGEIEAPIGLFSTYRNTVDDIAYPLEKIMENKKFDGLSLKLAVYNIAENLDTQHNELLKLITLKRYDSSTFVHLLNTAVLSMYFSSKLGFARDAVMDIGVAALFHDIGKLYISRRIIHKPDKLTNFEFSIMESHTVLGAKLLMQYVDDIGITPAVVSFEHHLKYDLGGYPKVHFKTKQHIASSIVSICDVYDALSQRRTYKADYPPDMIYNMMIHGRGSAYDPLLLDSFFKLMGVWPIGSIVVLSDNRVATVLEQNEDEIFSPIVKVIAPHDSKETINLKERKEFRIDRYLNPNSEGKEFLQLI